MTECKRCCDCVHLTLTAAYIGWYPGDFEQARMHCDKKHWMLDFDNDDESSIRRYFRLAETCKDFEVEGSKPFTCQWLVDSGFEESISESYREYSYGDVTLRQCFAGSQPTHWVLILDGAVLGTSPKTRDDVRLLIGC